MPWEADRLAGQRRKDRRSVAESQHPVDWCPFVELGHGFHERDIFVKANRQRLVLPRIVEQVTAVGGEEQLDAKARGRL